MGETFFLFFFAMIDKSSAITTILAKFKKLLPGHYLRLFTFKKDRSVTISKDENDQFFVQVDGFKQQSFKTDVKKIRKHLKILLKQEFPRSNKIRLSTGQ